MDAGGGGGAGESLENNKNNKIFAITENLPTTYVLVKCN